MASANNRSTKFNQLLLVGVKWTKLAEWRATTFLRSADRFLKDHPVAERIASAGLSTIVVVWFFHDHLDLTGWIIVASLSVKCLFKPRERVYWFLWGIAGGLLLRAWLGSCT